LRPLKATIQGEIGEIKYTRHWFSVMGTFLPLEIITYAI
jgi:hypothetical protein